MAKFILACAIIAALAHTVVCSEDEDTFCEGTNCYEVMRLALGASTKEVRASYRVLSKELHPDNAKGGGSEEKFQELARAYGVLKDSDRKKAYNSYLVSPERFPYMRRFRKSKPTPKIGVVPLLIGTMTFISIVQYLIAFYNRKSQIVNVSKRPEVRKKYKKEAEDKKLTKGKTKAQIEDVIQGLVAAEIPAVSYTDTIFFQLFGLPGAIVTFIKFSVLGQTPSDAEKITIISGYLGIKPEDWKELSEEEQKEYLAGDMYKKEVFFGTNKAPAVGSGKYKREKRMAKKAARDGPMQMRDD